MADLEYEHMLHERYREVLDEWHEARMEAIRLRGELETATAERDAALRQLEEARRALREVIDADVLRSRRHKERLGVV